MPLANYEMGLRKRGWSTYSVRAAGSALQYARVFWLVPALQLLPFLLGGARYFYLENHPDCAGLAHLRNGLREKLLIQARGLQEEHKHHEWCQRRAARRLSWFVLAFGFRDVRFAIQVLDQAEDDVQENTDPFPKGAELLPSPNVSQAPWWLRARIRHVLAAAPSRS